MKKSIQFFQNKRAPLKNSFYAVLGIMFILGTIFRFTNLNWDSYQAFHPDERNISWAVTRIRFFDQLNPKFFAYGGLPIYLYRAIAEGVAKITDDDSWLSEWGKIAVLGRYVSAALSSLSIILIYLVGYSYFSRATGLVSAAFLSFSPWAIREAHFATTETMLVLYLFLILIIAHKFHTKPTAIKTMLLGLYIGLATASKTTAILFMLIPLSAIWLRLFSKEQKPHNIGLKIIESLLYTGIFLLVAGGVFFLFSPYTLLDKQHFLESMRYETGVALGKNPVPYTLQFSHTKPYIYQFITMIWQSGPIIILGVIGMVLLTMQLLIKKDKKLILFLIFPVVYGTYAGSWFAKFGRYNVPFLPFATITAAWFFVFMIKRFLRVSSRLTGLASLTCVTLLLALHLFWGLANWTVYLRPQTRLDASKYLYETIKDDELIFTEHWNDGLPVHTQGMPERTVKRELLTVYDEDNDKKLSYYAERLPQATYIILSTRRMWAVLPNLPKRYPLTSVFYTKLLNEKLGYKEVATFTSYPQLFGISVNDDSAEESIQVFDHPTVRIFKNVENLDGEEIKQKLQE